MALPRHCLFVLLLQFRRELPKGKELVFTSSVPFKFVTPRIVYPLGDVRPHLYTEPGVSKQTFVDRVSENGTK